MTDALESELNKKEEDKGKGKKVRFDDSKESKHVARDGDGGLSDMDTDELEELVD